MLRQLILLGVCGFVCLGDASIPRLPKPDYERLDSDPDWLVFAAQFHGHLGPWATAGTRMGFAAVDAVEANGYFDLEVTCQGPFVKPPQSCFLDGLQVATGATLGKRNLHWKQGSTDDIVVRVRNTRTGAVVEIRPTSRLLGILASLKLRSKAADADSSQQHVDNHAVEALARTIASLPASEILAVTVVQDAGQPDE